MLSRIKIWILLLVVSVNGLPLPGQTPYFFHHKIIKGEKGYQSQVIFQDFPGFIWFGTSEGLIRFDGVDYTHFTMEDGMAGNNVTALCQNTDGTLWIGHRNGSITLLKDQQFSGFIPEEGLGTIPVTDIIADSSGTIWFSTTGEGIYYYSNNRLFNLNTDDGLADNYVYTLEVGPQGKIWIGTDLGISIYNPEGKEFQNISMSDGIPDNIIKKIVYDKKGKIWAGTDQAGIFYLDALSCQPFIFKNWTFGSINDFVIKQNEAWVSTTGSGVVQIIFDEENTARNKLITTRQGLYSNLTQSIYLDREKNLWIGTEDGVDQSITSVFEFLDQRHGLPFLVVYDFLIDENNFYWFCSDSGIFKLTESLEGTFNVENSFTGTPLESYNFISLYLDGNGYIWAGTYNQGVVRINPVTLEYQQFTTEDGLSDNNVISITASDEKLYLSTLGGGVSVGETGKDPMKFRDLTMDNPNISNYIYSTFVDSRERIWFAESGDQVHYMDGESLTSFGVEDDLHFNTVYCFTEDRDRNIYFSTEGNGMYCYNGERFIHYDESSGMASSGIRSVIADAYDNILIVSNEGIDLFHPGSRSFTHFGENYGVAYQEPQLNSIFRDKQGDIWIGTGNGLIKYNPDILFQDTIRPLLFLTGIELFSVPIEKGLTQFTHRDNYFTFRYTGLWHQDPGQVLYRFRLQGYDSDWSVPVANRFMTYPLIPPGTYTFEVQLTLDGGANWMGTENASYTFTISPPFWRTWWFLISSIITALLILWIIFRIRLAALKAQKKELESEVLKATEAIRSQNEELATRKNEIEQQQREITDSIHYAGRIQTALLPPEEDLESLLPSYFILNKPRDIVSGDYYWVSRKDNKVIVALADCTGHGVPGAFMSILGISFMNEIVNTSETLVASEILNELREYLVKSLHQTGKKEETRDGIEIALCVIDTSSKKLQYSGAHRPLYLVRENKLKEFKGDHMPIGVYDDAVNPFTYKEMQLKKNDIIYLFSDGYVDQLGGPDRKTFRSRRFKQLLVDIYQKPLEEQKAILEKEYEKWRGDIEQIDDIMVMGIRFSKS